MSVLPFKAATSSSNSERPWRIPRSVWLIASLLLLTILTLVAFTQSPRPDPFQAGSFPSLDWWRYPLERNSHERLPEIKCDLNNIFALPDRDLVWAVGNSGMIVHSPDGGRTWIQQKIEVPIGSESSRNRDDGAPPAPSASQSKRRRSATPRRQASEGVFSGMPDLLTVAYGSKRQGPPGQPAQTPTPLPTPDSKSQNQKPTPTPAEQIQKRPEAISTPTPSPKPAAEQQSIPTPTAKPAAQPTAQPTAQPAAAAKPSPTQSPSPSPTPTVSPAPSPTVTPQTAAEGAGTITIAEDLIAVHFADAKRGWILSRQGNLFATTNGGQGWERSLTDRPIQEFAPIKTAYFNDEGQIAEFSREEEFAYAYRFDESQHQYIRNLRFDRNTDDRYFIGDDGSIMGAVEDGTGVLRLLHRTREEQPPSAAGQYSRWPAPWYYLASLLCCLMLVPALKTRPEETLVIEESIADLGLSDRPIEAGDPDPLKFHLMALGLSRFIRNQMTLPPLTIAITGGWGSGKSSLMNLLRADLRRYGFRPVSFNAWHHQKEEHLPASLLQNVRLQAVPGWWTIEGWQFRLRLLWIRGWRLWAPVLTLLLIFAFSVSYTWHHPAAISAFGRTLYELISGLPGTRDQIGNRLLTLMQLLADNGSLLVLLASSVVIVISLIRGARAFRARPASLMADRAAGLKPRALDQQADFRSRFAREFQDVTKALGRRALPIFIDDLDRCRPDHILDVLEAVNFLSSSGDCYIVMGLSRDRIERCVGLSYLDVAEELTDFSEYPPESDGDVLRQEMEELGRLRRVHFARQYLDKLFNLEVPVPIPTADQARQLLVIPIFSAAEGGPGSRKKERLTARLWPALPIALILMCGVLAGRYLGQPSPAPPQQPIPVIEPPPVALTQATIVTDGAPAEPEPAPSPTPTPETRRELKPDQRAELLQPAPFADHISYWPLVVIGLLLAAAAVWYFRQPHDLIIKDSPEFEQALQIWHPLIYTKQNTPRSIKRFINRLRYLAMRQRPVHESHSRWQELKFGIERRLGLGSPAALIEDDPVTMPESVLVALAAMHYINPAWLQNERIFQEGAILNLPQSPRVQFHDEIEKEAWVYFQVAKLEHIKVFNNWVVLKQCRDAFLKLSAGIRTN